KGIVSKSIKQFVKRLLNSRIDSAPVGQPTRTQIWSIGIYQGKSPLTLAPALEINNPVLTHDSVSDAPAMFVADPFMLQAQGMWYMFFEVMNVQTGKGEIGLATSVNALRWRYQQIVLREPFHLSYPYVFQLENDYYMIPESYQANSIRLYKAVEFPTQWAAV